MKRQITIGIAIVAAVTVALGFVKYLQISAAMAQHASMKMPPSAVTTQIAKAEVWPDTIEAVGSLTAVQGVVLKADTQGVVTNVAFESGASVPAGAIILEVDSSVEAGKLKAARAMRDQAQRTYVRNQKLISESAMSKADLESAEAAYRSAEGEVAALEAQIAKKQIQAPFAGKLGVRRVNVGSYVSPGDVIIPLFDDSQLYVDFSVAQRFANQIKPSLTAHLSFEDGSSAQAEITAIDPQIDPKTRSLQARALLKNPAGNWRPGMFVRVSVELPNTQKLIALPSSSIQYAPYGDSVFVIREMKDKDGNAYKGVAQQIVKLGAQRGNQVAILTGVAEGDEVVTSGTFKLHQGSEVAVSNELAPVNDPKPAPANT